MTQSQYHTFDGNPSLYTNNPFGPYFQQQRNDSSQFESHGYVIHDQSTTGRGLSINQDVRLHSYEGSMQYLAGAENIAQDGSLSYLHTQKLFQAPNLANGHSKVDGHNESEYDIASPTAQDRQYNHTTVAQPLIVPNKLPTTVTRVGKPRSKRTGRAGVSQTRYSKKEDMLIAREFAKAIKKAKEDKFTFDMIGTVRSIASMLKGMPGGRTVSEQSVATRYWRMGTKYKGLRFHHSMSTLWKEFEVKYFPPHETHRLGEIWMRTNLMNPRWTRDLSSKAAAEYVHAHFVASEACWLDRNLPYAYHATETPCRSCKRLRNTAWSQKLADEKRCGG